MTCVQGLQGASKFGLLFMFLSALKNKGTNLLFAASNIRMRKGCLAWGHCILGNVDLPQGSFAFGLVAHCTAVTAV